MHDEMWLGMVKCWMEDRAYDLRHRVHVVIQVRYGNLGGIPGEGHLILAHSGPSKGPKACFGRSKVGVVLA